MQVSLGDLETLGKVASRVDTNPLSFAGRFLGLSGPEQRAGVPVLGWVCVGIGAGLLAGYWLRGSKIVEKVSAAL